MTTQTATLSDFLLARIAEDESCWEDEAEVLRLRDDTSERRELIERVLAECEAKREIVRYFHMLCEQGQQHEVFGYHATGLQYAIRQLAAIYDGHPDYQEEWRA